MDMLLLEVKKIMEVEPTLSEKEALLIAQYRMLGENEKKIFLEKIEEMANDSLYTTKERNKDNG